MKSLVPLLFVISLTLPALGQSTVRKKAKKAPAPFAWNNPMAAESSKKAGLPDGLRHATFESESMGLEVGYFIYLPEVYTEAPKRKFPVVFHLHGGRPGSEKKSVRLSKFVDEAIKAGTIQPTIYVFPNGGPMSWYNYPQKENGMGEDIFVKELIPHIQATYRTRELALEGFSQGGRGTTRIMMKYPELFVSAAPGGSGYSNEKRVQENDGAESENVVFARGYNTWDIAAEYAKREDKTELPILLWVGTKGFNFENNLEYSSYLKSLGIPHDFLEAPEIEHSANGIYEIRGDELMGFHQKHFAKP